MVKKVSLYFPESETLLVETNRSIDLALKESVEFSITEYCILQQLNIYDKKALSTVFQEFLLLKPNSVTSALARLENRGFVTKEFNEKDQRTYFVEITQAGRNVAETATQAIQQILQKRTWKNPDDERIYSIMKINALLGYKHAMSLPTEEADNESSIMPGWVIVLKYLQQMLTTTLRNLYGCSLSEFRILELLVQNHEMRVVDISRKLILDKSVISLMTKRLKAKGLIDSQVNAKDKRSISVSITPEGERLEKEAHQKLTAQYDEFYESISAEDSVKMSEWYKTMYRALYL